MSEQRHQLSDGYELVGDMVEPWDVELGVGAATALHDRLAQDFFPTVMHSFPKFEMVPKLSETMDITKFSASFGRHPDYAPDLKIGGSIGIRLRHDANSWLLRMAMARYVHDGTINKTTTRYFIDVIGNSVLQAKVQNRLMRSNSIASVDASSVDDVQALGLTRTAYERPLTAKDCIRLETLLHQAARRRMHTDRHARLEQDSLQFFSRFAAVASAKHIVE